MGECRLLGGPAATSAQLVLAALAMASLLYKRYVGQGSRKQQEDRPHSPPLLTAIAAAALFAGTWSGRSGRSISGAWM